MEDKVLVRVAGDVHQLSDVGLRSNADGKHIHTHLT